MSDVANCLTSVTFDCRDPARLAAFWRAVLDSPAGCECDGPDWATVGSRADPQPPLTFQKVSEPKTSKVRIHLDVEVDDIEAGRRQVEDLGGCWSGERHDYEEGIVMVMRDPEEHEFCLVPYFDAAPSQTAALSAAPAPS
jgi:predicted enzyme related to lactoylglutathione lyase